MAASFSPGESPPKPNSRISYDPLHRRYVKIPRIPDDLMASIPSIGTTHLFPILAPAGENDDEESFKVICAVHLNDKAKAVAFVFSSCNQTWTSITSTFCLPNGGIGYMASYAHGCFYWMVYGMGCALMLDTTERKFSITDLPPHKFDSWCAIVEAGEDRLGFLAVCDGAIDLYRKNWQSNGVGAQEWQHDKLIPLPKDYEINYNWHIVGTLGRYVVLLASDAFCNEWPPEYFVLDIKTLLFEKLCPSKKGVVYFGIPYEGFPPPLALPSIRNGMLS